MASSIHLIKEVGSFLKILSGVCIQLKKTSAVVLNCVAAEADTLDKI